MSTVKQHRDWVLDAIIDFDERESAGSYGFGFGKDV
jgi:hypothetical protein